MPASQAGRRRFESGRPLQNIRGLRDTARSPLRVSLVAVSTHTSSARLDLRVADALAWSDFPMDPPLPSGRGASGTSPATTPSSDRAARRAAGPPAGLLPLRVRWLLTAATLT